MFQCFKCFNKWTTQLSSNPELRLNSIYLRSGLWPVVVVFAFIAGDKKWFRLTFSLSTSFIFVLSAAHDDSWSGDRCYITISGKFCITIRWTFGDLKTVVIFFVDKFYNENFTYVGLNALRFWDVLTDHPRRQKMEKGSWYNVMRWNSWICISAENKYLLFFESTYLQKVIH
jgi:hypothetical protein